MNWEQVKIAVGRYSSRQPLAFANSISFWIDNRSADGRSRFESTGDLSEKVDCDDSALVLVDGDLKTHVTFSADAILLILGDVSGLISVGSHSEVIVAGAITSSGYIVASSMCAIAVGGEFAGTLRCLGMAEALLMGDFCGEILTGLPSTKLHIQGNFDGKIRPDRESSQNDQRSKGLLHLDVSRFMAFEHLKEIAAYNYTHFQAGVTQSDKPDGFYPEATERQRMKASRHFVHWTIGGS